MNKRERLPVYVYDEPITLSNFTGGLNTDPSSSNLFDYELMEALNVSYINKSLQRRLGASLYKNLEFSEENPEQQRGIIQGQFTLTARLGTYYLVVRDGLIYFASLDHQEDTTVLQHLAIDISEDLFVNAAGYDPENVLAGLDIYQDDTNLPNKFLDNEGYVYKKPAVTDTDYLISELDDPDESGLYIPAQNRLVLQNNKKVGGAVFDNVLYLATGTRFLRVYETALHQLKAEIVPPKKIVAWEKATIGENFLSPFPYRHVVSDHEDQDGIYNQYTADFRVHGIRLNDMTGTTVNLTTILGLGVGRDYNDYYFKWEVRDVNGDWFTIYDYAEDNHRESILVDLSTISPTIITGESIRVKVTATEEMVQRSDRVMPDPPSEGATPEAVAEYQTLYGTWNADGSLNDYYWKPNDITRVLEVGSIKIGLEEGVMTEEIATQFTEIHTCNQILADGNKLILYGTPYKSANWYKSVIGEFAYFTNQGQLDFQTNKNERIVRCAHLDGNIIVFANNPYLGGSIHAVTGNGDDYNDGQYYSPYKKKIVHDSISCDHPNSVQYVDNYLVFKNKSTFWQLQSRELNSERVQLISLNDNVNHNNPETSMPIIEYGDGYEFELYTYIDEDTYTVVFPKHGVQYKMYYKLGNRYPHNTNKTIYPWLRDKTDYLNCQDVTKIKNIPTYLTEGFKLIQFTNVNCNDLGDKYFTRIQLKAHALEAVGVVKYLMEIMTEYYRGETDNFRLNLRAYNEASYLIAGEKLSAFVDKETNKVRYDNPLNYYSEGAPTYDKPVLNLGKTEFHEAKMYKQYLYNRIYHIDKKFPFTNVSVLIETDAEERFALNSITFNYTSSDYPTQNLPNLYENIFKDDYNSEVIVTGSSGDPLDLTIDYSSSLKETERKLSLAADQAEEVMERIQEYQEVLNAPTEARTGDITFEED